MSDPIENHPDTITSGEWRRQSGACPYSEDVIARLHERAESYRQSGPSAFHTADLLDEAAGAISALVGRGVGLRAGMMQAVWTLRNVANVHEAEADLSKKIAAAEGNLFAARVLRSYANSLEMDAGKEP